MPTLLDDLLSADTSRVLHAMWQIIGSRDPAQLDELLPYAARIRHATARLALGGLLRSNSRTLDHALDKLDLRRHGECWCASYPGLDQYEPQKEQSAGHVRILSTSEPGWSMTYACECAVCGRIFDVEQGDYHIMWWRWVPRGEKLRAPAVTRHRRAVAH